MASTRRIFLRDKMLGGVDTTTPPHLLPDNVWSDVYNFRVYEGRLEQFSPFVLASPKFAPTETAHFLVSLSSNRTSFPLSVAPAKAGRNLYVALGDQVYQARPEAGTPLVALTYADGTAFSPSGLWNLTHYIPWGWTVYANQVWFTQPGVPLHYTDGTHVGTFTTELPSSHILENFFDHLFTANAIWKSSNEPYTVRWCHLYDMSQWEPTAENEADSYDVYDWVSHDKLSLGVTATKRLGDTLFVYTTSSIIRCDYVGLPKVVRFAPVEIGIGCAAPYAIASNKSSHFFFDDNEMDFFEFDGRTLRSIGNPVQTFFDSIYDVDKAQRGMYANILPERTEVWWAFPHTQNFWSYFLIYNWSTQAWSIKVDWEVSHIGGQGVRALTCDELAGTCDNLTNGVEQLADFNTAATPRLYCNPFASALTGFARTSTAADVIDASPLRTAYLVTGDRYFGSLDKVKEMDGVTIDADWTDGKCDGVLVELSARERLSDTVTYAKQGVWNKKLKDNFLPFPKRVPGKIHRWRFTMLGSPPSTVVWNAFAEHVYGAEAER